MYESIQDLPDIVRDVLPERAQELYLEAFNEAWEEYDEEKTSEMSQESVANREGWAAVRKEYTHDDKTGKWYHGEVPEDAGEEEEEGIIGKLEDLVSGG
jgi:cation transport regulator